MSHVLIVDDNEMVRYVLARYVRAAGHQVSSAADGFRAIALCGESHVDVLITDQNMPAMTGDVLIARARALYPHLRCILVSANAVEPHLVRSGTTCLMKPVSRKYLISLI
jgi:CheY-like chemotaxis protein